jgi:hypothetical protein
LMRRRPNAASRRNSARVAGERPSTQLIGMTDVQSRGAGKAARKSRLFAGCFEPSIVSPRPNTGRSWGSVMNNFSLLTADRATHLKVVAVALVCAMLVAGVGLAARVADADGRLEATVIKPATPVTASVSEPRTIR